MKKALKLIYKIFRACLVVFIILFVLTVCIQRFSNNTISIFSFRMFSVVTGSMEPDYKIGDVILCKETDVAKLKVGDDITYLGDSGSFKDRIVTHRIINITTNENGELLFYTKGIASTSVDPIVKSNQIYGKIVSKLTVLSFIYKLVSTSQGFYLGIFVPLVILIGSEVIISLVERYEEKNKLNITNNMNNNTNNDLNNNLMNNNTIDNNINNDINNNNDNISK